MKLTYALPPHPRAGPNIQQPHEREHVQIRTRAHVVLSRNIHTPTPLLALQRTESAGGVRDRGSYTAPLSKRFEAGESGQQLRDETELGTLVVPNLWGAEVVQRSFGGGRANDRLVPNLLPSTHPRVRK